ncbi:hypothetical protein QQ045_006463 [Rhodiola kirilowii]
MQGSTGQPEAILEWLHKEIGYRPLAPYSTLTKVHSPSPDSVRKVCRGNMIPVWNFLLTRVKSEKTVEKIRRNIHVHGGSGADGVVKEKPMGGRRKESASGGADAREAALQEVERCPWKKLKGRGWWDELSNYYRHKQVMLEAYDQQCDEAAKIFIEYQKRISFHANNDKEAVYSTVRGTKSADDVILIETARERNIRKACESFASYMIEKIRHSFPAYEGSGILFNPRLEVEKISFDYCSTASSNYCSHSTVENINFKTDREN